VGVYNEKNQTGLDSAKRYPSFFISAGDIGLSNGARILKHNRGCLECDTVLPAIN